MKLFLLGATGRTGTELLAEALSRGHEVTAFVRSPSKLERVRPRLTVVAGNPHDAEQLARALPGHDAVLSALGPRPRDALLGGSSLLADCANSTVQAMQAANVRRLLIVSAALLFPGGGLKFAFFRWLLRHHVADLAVMEQTVRSTSLDWTIARPPKLVLSRESAYRAESEAFPAGGYEMSFRSVAAFVLDAVEHSSHSQRIVGLAA